MRKRDKFLNMKHILPLIPILGAVLLAVPASAQSASEIAAAKSVARSYGYTDSEISAVLNHNIGGTVTADAPADSATASPIAATVPVAEVTVIEAAEEQVAVDIDDIYGHSFFTSSGLSVIPSYNAPVPSAYVLGPGDELMVDIWGATVSHVVATIGNDGAISISDLGPVYLSGFTLTKAETYLKEQLGRIYSGLLGNEPDTFMKLSIGKIKGVSINVSGEVFTPGLYSIPSLATIPSVIFMAGGVGERGSVRNVTLFRHGRKVADFDLYDFLFKGRFNENLRIQDGDVINVPAYSGVVEITGAVARPMRYEIVDGETIADVVSYADGFTIDAQKTSVNVYRRGVQGNTSYDVKEEDFASFGLCDGDRISVRTYNSQDQNTVSIFGPVKYPGSYALGEGITDIHTLVSAAGGLMDGAYTLNGQIKRLDKDRLPAFVSFNLDDVLSGKTSIVLEREDSVTLFTKADLVENKTVSIEGHVQEPGEFTFSEGMTVLDLILLSRGVREDYYGNRGHIRRISAGEVPVMLSFNLDEVLSGVVNIPLQREDTVRIFSKEELRDDATVTIGGEVKSEGTFPYYVGMTLEDIILTGGNFTNGADLRNVQIAHRGGRERGSVEVVDLENNPALFRKELLPYDVISVRRLTYFRNQITVTVNGEVISPGPYAFDEAEIRLSDVVSKVGGFTDAAFKPGASLTRVLTSDEIERREIAGLIASHNKSEIDSVDFEEISDSYRIGIDLEKAIAKPGSTADITLRDGDVINVPVLNNTVKISGGVLFPNTVSFDEDLSWRAYVRQAGGFSKLALKSKTYAVYMNGKIAVGNRIRVEPGMEIIVPEKDDSERQKLTAYEASAIASASTSIVSLILAIIRMF